MTTTAGRPNDQSKRVLVVDDVAEARELARLTLERHGFEVAEAEDVSLPSPSRGPAMSIWSSST